MYTRKVTRITALQLFHHEVVYKLCSYNTFGMGSVGKFKGTAEFIHFVL